MAIIFLDDFFVVVNAYILMQKPLVTLLCVYYYYYSKFRSPNLRLAPPIGPQYTQEERKKPMLTADGK